MATGRKFERPFITAFSDSDPVTKGGALPFQRAVFGAKGQPHVTLKGKHFLQEDCPNDIVAVMEGVTARSRA